MKLLAHEGGFLWKKGKVHLAYGDGYDAVMCNKFSFLGNARGVTRDINEVTCLVCKRAHEKIMRKEAK